MIGAFWTCFFTLLGIDQSIIIRSVCCDCVSIRAHKLGANYVAQGLAVTANILSVLRTVQNPTSLCKANDYDSTLKRKIEIYFTANRGSILGKQPQSLMSLQVGRSVEE